MTFNVPLMHNPDAHNGGKNPVVVIGLGNPLMSDDGVGLVLWELVQKARDWGNDVIFEDGGTSGMSMLPLVEDALTVIFLDGTRTGGMPGDLIIRRDDELPAYFSHVLSPHQIGLREVLGAAQLRGFMPEKLSLIGIEIESVAFACGLTPAVEQALPQAVSLAVAEIESALTLIPHDA
ncbi:MAG: HyaD/HybD family hydrogenase maturation endopeptidase [Akkermansia sp.]